MGANSSLFHVFELLVLFLHLLWYLCIFLGQLLRVLQNLLLFLLFSHDKFLQIVADSKETWKKRVSCETVSLKAESLWSREEKGTCRPFESQNNSKKHTIITLHWLYSISVLLSPWHLTLWDYTVEFICLWETHTRYWQSRFFCRKKSFSRVRNSTALFFSASNAFFSFSTSFTRFSWNREHVLLSNMK